MTWWKWGLVGVALALGLFWGGFVFGVTTQRRDDTEQRLRLGQQLDSIRIAHAVTVARLEAKDVSRETAVRSAKAEAEQADRRAASANRRAAAAEELVASATTKDDSIAAYQEQVATLKMERDEERAAKTSYRIAMEAGMERAAGLLERIAVDSAALHDSRVRIAKLITPAAPTASPLGGLARKAETVAIAAATAGACRQSLFSIGCISGLVVTGGRIK